MSVAVRIRPGVRDEHDGRCEHRMRHRTGEDPLQTRSEVVPSPSVDLSSIHGHTQSMPPSLEWKADDVVLRRRFGGVFAVLIGFMASVHAFALDPPPASEAASPSVAPQSALTRGLVERGTLTVEIIDADEVLRNGPDYQGGTIYLPKDRDGALPAVVIVPGFKAREVSIKKWGPFLASHGILTMTIGTNELNARPRDRAKALLDAVETLRTETERSGSPLEGRIDPERIAVAGWSMGGGGAQHAAVRDPDIAAVVAFCPWHDGIRIRHSVPLLVIAGETDFLASADGHARRHFESVTDETPRLYFEVRRAGHWVANDPGNARGEVGRSVASWLKWHLEGDERYDAVLDVEPTSAVHYERLPVDRDGSREADSR